MDQAQIKHGADIDEMASLYNKDISMILDYSSNINPKTPANLEVFIADAIKNLTRYPDLSYQELRLSIANYLNMKPQNIIPGNGASEIIYLLMKTLNKRLAILNPTFGEYERSARLSGLDVVDVFYDLEKDFEINLEQIKNNLDGFDSLIICNPNNPTGRVQDLKPLLELLKDNDKLLIVDETFMEFWHESDKVSLLRYVDEYQNLIIIKAVTKFFGLPGIRLGYGISSNQELISKMWQSKEPWTVNTFAEKVCPRIFEDKEYIKTSKEFYKEEIEFMDRELSKIDGLRSYKTNTNFVLLKLDKVKASDFKEKMFKEKDILIRDASNFKGLDQNYIRIAIKDRTNNERVLIALKNLLGG